MIAFDRYIATNYPIHYRQARHSISLALRNIFIVWFAAFAICLLPTIFFEKKREIYSDIENKTVSISTTKYKELTRQCELYKDRNFVVTSSLLSFYIPLIIMIFLYAKVLYAIKQQSLLLNKNSSKNSNFDSSLRTQQSEPALTQEELSSPDQQQVGRREITAEVRITRSLAIVIGCFICCWFPFFRDHIKDARVDMAFFTRLPPLPPSRTVHFSLPLPFDSSTLEKEHQQFEEAGVVRCDQVFLVTVTRICS